MSALAELKGATVATLAGTIASRLDGSESLEEAAQAFVETMYGQLPGSFVLVRMFMTIPYGQLPDETRRCVMALAEARGVGSELDAHMPVLTLLGTCGDLPDWNDRRTSKSHAGIPLISREFVDSIPMLARLLSDLGLDLDLQWLELEDGLDISTSGTIGGLFFVPDARTCVDSRGRAVIPNQDFVEAHGVRTVVGIGGRYMLGRKSIVASVFFTKELLRRDQVTQLQRLINVYKKSTTKLAGRQLVFAD